MCRGSLSRYQSQSSVLDPPIQYMNDQSPLGQMRVELILPRYVPGSQGMLAWASTWVFPVSGGLVKSTTSHTQKIHRHFFWCSSTVTMMLFIVTSQVVSPVTLIRPGK